MGREGKMAVVTSLNSWYSNQGPTVFATTSTVPLSDVPTINKHFDREDIDNGKKILLKDSNGKPLLPISADYVELMDMYAELAKRVFYLEARLNELEGERDENNEYERVGQSVVLESPIRTI